MTQMENPINFRHCPECHADLDHRNARLSRLLARWVKQWRELFPESGAYTRPDGSCINLSRVNGVARDTAAELGMSYEQMIDSVEEDWISRRDAERENARNPGPGQMERTDMPSTYIVQSILIHRVFLVASGIGTALKDCYIEAWVTQDKETAWRLVWGNTHGPNWKCAQFGDTHDNPGGTPVWFLDRCSEGTVDTRKLDANLANIKQECAAVLNWIYSDGWEFPLPIKP